MYPPQKHLIALATGTFLGFFVAGDAKAQINTIADFDFDTPTTAAGGFGFSGLDGNPNNPLAVTYSVGAGVPGATGLGGEVKITSSNASNLAAGTFAGGGVGSFNLGLDPQFVAGAITADLLEKVTVAFDLSTLNGASLDTPRFQPSGANSFDNRINLTSIPATTSGFESYTVNFADLDPFEVESFASTLNANETTNFTLQFNLDTVGEDPNATYVTNHGFAVDNILVTSLADLTIPLVTLDAVTAAGPSNSNFGGVIAGTQIYTLNTDDNVIEVDTRPATANGTAFVSQFNATLPDGFAVTVGEENTQFEIDIRLVEGNEADQVYVRHNNTGGGGGFGNYGIDISGLTIGDPEFTTLTIPFDVDSFSFGEVEALLIDDTEVQFTQFGFTTSFSDSPSVFEIGAIRVANVIDTGGLPGDANGDGSVDLLDLDILGSNFGLTEGATVAQGDFNSDGAVDLLDLDILGSNFGLSTGGAIPEPLSATLVLVASACGCLLRRSAR